MVFGTCRSCSIHPLPHSEPPVLQGKALGRALRLETVARHSVRPLMFVNLVLPLLLGIESLGIA